MLGVQNIMLTFRTVQKKKKAANANRKAEMELCTYTYFSVVYINNSLD